MYNLPVFKQLILLLHWILVSMHDLAGVDRPQRDWTWGLAIIGLTIIVRLVLFPLTWKQFSSAQAMQAHPAQASRSCSRSTRATARKLQQETMKLYQEHRVNPFASCLPSPAAARLHQPVLRDQGHSAR